VCVCIYIYIYIYIYTQYFSIDYIYIYIYIYIHAVVGDFNSKYLTQHSETGLIFKPISVHEMVNIINELKLILVFSAQE
jgi:hypothetical protein